MKFKFEKCPECGSNEIIISQNYTDIILKCNKCGHILHTFSLDKIPQEIKKAEQTFEDELSVALKRTIPSLLVVVVLTIVLAVIFKIISARLGLPM